MSVLTRQILVAKDEGLRNVAMVVVGQDPDGTANVGWAVGVGHRGRGLGTSVVGAVLDKLFASGIKEVVCRADPANLASRRLAASLGFVEPAGSGNGLGLRVDRKSFEARAMRTPVTHARALT